jgi:hypothetical protein
MQLNKSVHARKTCSVLHVVQICDILLHMYSSNALKQFILVAYTLCAVWIYSMKFGRGYFLLFVCDGRSTERVWIGEIMD